MTNIQIQLLALALTLIVVSIVAFRAALIYYFCRMKELAYVYGTLLRAVLLSSAYIVGYFFFLPCATTARIALGWRDSARLQPARLAASFAFGMSWGIADVFHKWLTFCEARCGGPTIFSDPEREETWAD